MYLTFFLIFLIRTQILLKKLCMILMMAAQPPTIKIPEEIIKTIANFPELSNFKIRPGPSFIEYKWDVNSFVIGLFIFGIAFIIIGIGLTFVEWWFGLIFLCAGIFPIYFGVNILKSHLMTFVIDYATDLLYAGDKDIPFSNIKSIQLMGMNLGWAEIFGISLNYSEQSSNEQKTMIFRTWTNDVQTWQNLGIYFSQVLSNCVHHEIPFYNLVFEGKTDEKCLYYIKFEGSTSISWSK